MNKQQGSTVCTTIKVSRRCYIIAKRFAFLSFETILARTIHIFNSLLNWFWTLFKNVYPLTKRQEKGICWIFERNLAHLAHRLALRTLIIASAERLKSLFMRQRLPEYVVFGQYMSPMRVLVLLSNPQSGVNALHIVSALNYFTLVCNVISVLVEMVIFAMVEVDNFCNNKLIAV